MKDPKLHLSTNSTDSLTNILTELFKKSCPIIMALSPLLYNSICLLHSCLLACPNSTFSFSNRNLCPYVQTWCPNLELSAFLDDVTQQMMQRQRVPILDINCLDLPLVNRTILFRALPTFRQGPSSTSAFIILTISLHDFLQKYKLTPSS